MYFSNPSNITMIDKRGEHHVRPFGHEHADIAASLGYETLGKAIGAGNVRAWYHAGRGEIGIHLKPTKASVRHALNYVYDHYQPGHTIHIDVHHKDHHLNDRWGDSSAPDYGSYSGGTGSFSELDPNEPTRQVSKYATSHNSIKSAELRLNTLLKGNPNMPPSDIRQLHTWHRSNLLRSKGLPEASRDWDDYPGADDARAARANARRYGSPVSRLSPEQMRQQKLRVSVQHALLPKYVAAKIHGDATYFTTSGSMGPGVSTVRYNNKTQQWSHHGTSGKLQFGVGHKTLAKYLGGLSEDLIDAVMDGESAFDVVEALFTRSQSIGTTTLFPGGGRQRFDRLSGLDIDYQRGITIAKPGTYQPTGGSGEDRYNCSRCGQGTRAHGEKGICPKNEDSGNTSGVSCNHCGAWYSFLKRVPVDCEACGKKIGSEKKAEHQIGWSDPN